MLAACDKTFGEYNYEVCDALKSLIGAEQQDSIKRLRDSTGEIKSEMAKVQTPLNEARAALGKAIGSAETELAKLRDSITEGDISRVGERSSRKLNAEFDEAKDMEGNNLLSSCIEALSDIVNEAKRATEEVEQYGEQQKKAWSENLEVRSSATALLRECKDFFTKVLRKAELLPASHNALVAFLADNDQKPAQTASVDMLAADTQAIKNRMDELGLDVREHVGQDGQDQVVRLMEERSALRVARDLLEQNAIMLGSVLGRSVTIPDIGSLYCLAETTIFGTQTIEKTRANIAQTK